MAWKRPRRLMPEIQLSHVLCSGLLCDLVFPFPETKATCFHFVFQATQSACVFFLPGHFSDLLFLLMLFFSGGCLDVWRLGFWELISSMYSIIFCALWVPSTCLFVLLFIVNKQGDFLVFSYTFTCWYEFLSLADKKGVIKGLFLLRRNAHFRVFSPEILTPKLGQYC